MGCTVTDNARADPDWGNENAEALYSGKCLGCPFYYEERSKDPGLLDHYYEKKEGE